MNDRFKFRIFLKAHNQMCNVHTLHTGTNKVIISTRYGNSSVQINDYNILMQCTGLKDKNGNLIYEGDIVKNNQNSLYSVEFEEFGHQTKFCLKRIENPDYYPHISTWQGVGYKDQKNYEVIGNIYENPELLEEVSE